MPHLTTNGVELYYEIHGEGEPLLMLAGFASDSQSWAPILPTLATRYRAAGRTRPIDAPLSSAAMASDYAALLDALEIDSAHVVGHSMGGRLAMHMAANHGERVDRLVLLATSAQLHSRGLSIIDNITSLREAGAADELWLTSLFHWLFRPQFFDDPRQVEAALAMAIAYPHMQPASAMRAQANFLREEEFNVALENIHSPTLAILAAGDLLLPFAEASASLRSIPQIEVEGIENAGHSVHWDAPERIASRIVAFLAQGG